jgi:GNAT superfamily N-acetyltransferase
MLNLTATEKSAQIQENLVTYMRLFAGLPGITMRDDDAFWCICHRGAPGDGILRARWPEEGVEDQIDRLLEQVGALTSEIGWMVFPCDRPATLGQRLATRGMPVSTAGNWLWADLTSLALPPAVSSDFRIEPVQDDAAMAAWVQASEAGFGGELLWFYEAYSRHGYAPRAASRHFIGYLGDIPVTSGTLLEAGSCASIYDVSTLPEYRRHGFGGALSYYLMAQIQAMGYPETWIWSSNLGLSVYRKLGFVDADFGIREYAWRK